MRNVTDLEATVESLEKKVNLLYEIARGQQELLDLNVKTEEMMGKEIDLLNRRIKLLENTDE